jgi:hypothetical protein
MNAQRVVVTVFKKAFLGQKLRVEKDLFQRMIREIVMKSQFIANQAASSAAINGTQLAFVD